jgi:hypothetical protein
MIEFNKECKGIWVESSHVIGYAETFHKMQKFMEAQSVAQPNKTMKLNFIVEDVTDGWNFNKEDYELFIPNDKCKERSYNTAFIFRAIEHAYGSKKIRANDGRPYRKELGKCYPLDVRINLDVPSPMYFNVIGDGWYVLAPMIDSNSKE